MLKDYAIEKGFEYVKMKNCKDRVTAKCQVDSCPFHVHASHGPNGNLFIIKTLIDKHTCQIVKRNKMVSYNWITSKLAENFKDYPELDFNATRTILWNKYAISISNTKLYRA